MIHQQLFQKLEAIDRFQNPASSPIHSNSAFRSSQEAERSRAIQYGEEAGTLHKQNGTLMGAGSVAGAAAVAAASLNTPSPGLSLQTALVKGKVKLALYYKVCTHWVELKKK